jgi:hypothetical protein
VKGLRYLAATLFALGAAHAARADQIIVSGSGFADSGGAVGYQAIINYDAGGNVNEGTLTIKLTNTLGNGNITAFLFNIAGTTSMELLDPNPTDLVAGGTAFWNLTSETALSDTEPGSPYGKFEAGLGIGANPGTGSDASFTGSGSGGDVEGIGRLAGGANGVESGLFKWTIKGTGADALTALSFASSQSTGGGQHAAFLVRFKGVPDASGRGDGGSAKIPGGEPTVPGTVPVPLPGAASAGIALLAIFGLGRKRHSRR